VIGNYSDERGSVADLGEKGIERILEELLVTVRSLYLGGSVMSKAHLSSLRSLREREDWRNWASGLDL
jgi:hypothetical protein